LTIPPHTYYSHRTGSNPNLRGLPLFDVIELFLRVFDQLKNDGYFSEAFGYECVDAGYVHGEIQDIELKVLLDIRKKHIWPPHVYAENYSEDDFFDILEFLFQHVSKPVEGTMHSWGDCGMHWETFNHVDGRTEYRMKINAVLNHYEKRYELSADGQILTKAEVGFEPIFEADIPSKDVNVVNRINASVLAFRRHGATLDDRRNAVRDLADVLEYLRPQVKEFLTANDEKDLFNLANNFGVRHHNDKQKTGYDAALWLSWMFYFYLSTIHVLLRKSKNHDAS
jgi:hypothetical protein